jgi:hypothetical protein
MAVRNSGIKLVFTDVEVYFVNINKKELSND